MVWQVFTVRCRYGLRARRRLCYLRQASHGEVNLGHCLAGGVRWPQAVARAWPLATHLLLTLSPEEDLPRAATPGAAGWATADDWCWGLLGLAGGCWDLLGAAGTCWGRGAGGRLEWHSQLLMMSVEGRPCCISQGAGLVPGAGGPSSLLLGFTTASHRRPPSHHTHSSHPTPPHSTPADPGAAQVRCGDLEGRRAGRGDWCLRWAAAAAGEEQLAPRWRKMIRRM